MDSAGAQGRSTSPPVVDANHLLSITIDDVRLVFGGCDMVELVRVFAEARAFREEAERARRLAATTSGRLQGELHQIATLYDKLADGKDPENPARHPIVATALPQLERLSRFRTAWPD